MVDNTVHPHSIRYAQALAYVWGCHDSGGTRVGSAEFARAYTEYRANGGKAHITLQAAYRAFLKFGEIILSDV